MSDPRATLSAERIAIIREVLSRVDRGGALLSSRRNFAWATAGGINHVVLATEDGAAPLLVTPTEAIVLAPVNEADRIADEELAGLGIDVARVPWHDADSGRAEAERRCGGPPAMDADLEEHLRPIRSRLAPLDHDRMAWLARKATKAIEAALAGVRAGDREASAASAALAALAAEDVRAPVVLAAADDRIARYRHPLPGQAPVERRLMLVVVAERWGLHAAVTRIRDLEPAPPEIAEREAALRQVERALLAATVPGATLGEVLDSARAAYARLGMPDEWRNHHQGGTIGYATREVIATPGEPARLEAGMAVAWNPSMPGVKLEDTHLLGADGTLTKVTASS